MPPSLWPIKPVRHHPEQLVTQERHVAIDWPGAGHEDHGGGPATFAWGGQRACQRNGPVGARERHEPFPDGLGRFTRFRFGVFSKHDTVLRGLYPFSSRLR